MHKPTDQPDNQGQTGLVISYFGNSVAVEAASGQVFQCHLRRNQELPVVGDKVMWTLEADNTGLVTQILPRETLLARGGSRGGKARPIAANINTLVIVMAPPPIFAEFLVDRYTVAAELLNIHPVIVINKSDLLDAATPASFDARLAIYRNVPYPVVLSSIKSKHGLAELQAFLHDKTAALVGPSGVGKSSIIAALGGETIRTTEVSAKGAGKHTTTATRLYHLPHGGHLIDSPGVREFNLWPVTKADVLRGFGEFQAYLSGCRFRDCLHVAEPDCAVQSAVADGKISAQRYASFQALMKEADNNERNKYNQ